MRFLFDMTVAQRRTVLAVSALSVLAIAYANKVAEEMLHMEVEALFLAPVAAVAWAWPRRASLVFASYTAAVATISCVVVGPFSAIEAGAEIVVHTGTFLSAAFVVNLLAAAMTRQNHCARFDALTEAANATHFRELTDLELARARRHARPVTVAFLDLDNFKQLNDGFGHVAGDHALRTSAELMREQVRVTDVIGRLGGDEFGILMPETDEADSHAVLERLRAAIKERASEEGWPIGASVGAVTVRGDAGDVTSGTVIKRADALMYRVKSTSKDGVLIEPFA